MTDGCMTMQDDDYVCAAFKVDEDEELYITKFRVEGTAERAHHMILSGCGDVPPEASNPSWSVDKHSHYVIIYRYCLETAMPPRLAVMVQVIHHPIVSLSDFECRNCGSHGTCRGHSSV